MAWGLVAVVPICVVVSGSPVYLLSLGRAAETCSQPEDRVEVLECKMLRLVHRSPLTGRGPSGSLLAISSWRIMRRMKEFLNNIQVEVNENEDPSRQSCYGKPVDTYQKFLIALSVRPGTSFAISVHLFPNFWTAARMIASSCNQHLRVSSRCKRTYCNKHSAAKSVSHVH